MHKIKTLSEHKLQMDRITYVSLTIEIEYYIAELKNVHDVTAIIYLYLHLNTMF